MCGACTDSCPTGSPRSTERPSASPSGLRSNVRCGTTTTRLCPRWKKPSESSSDQRSFPRPRRPQSRPVVATHLAARARPLFGTERGLVLGTRRWRGSATVPKRRSTRASGATRRQRSNRPVRAHLCRMPQDPDVDAGPREHRHNKHGDGMADRSHHAARSE